MWSILRRNVTNQARCYSTANTGLKACVVGAGPSGFYTTKYLLKEIPDASVDLVEALPTPYGLVRYGVAPDHPEVKSVENDFEKVANDPRVEFMGNVNIGEDVSIEALKDIYDVIVLAYGAKEDRSIGLDGEHTFKNVFAAREFVNWYNGHPEYRTLNPNVNGKTAIVVGVGNVAIDCARILTKSTEELAETDITQDSLDLLKTSSIERVVVIGRRGHVQASFTLKEIRELSKLKDVGLIVHESELELGTTEESKEEISQLRAKKRMNDFLLKIAKNIEEESKKPRQIELRFLATPMALESTKNDQGEEVITGLRIERNKLQGEAFKQTPVGSGEFETIPCSLLLKSIGYRSTSIPGIPFDDKRSVVQNKHGKVFSDDDPTSAEGLYTAGWVKRGPSGIIGTNITDAKETVSQISNDFKSNVLPRTLKNRSTSLKDVVPKAINWDQYQVLEKEEKKRGTLCNPSKPREKILTVEEMLQVATN